MEEVTELPVWEWKIENFCCWNYDVHGKAISSPHFRTLFWIDVYPRGEHGTGEHLYTRLFYSPNHDLLGDLTYIGSDGSLLFRQKVITNDSAGFISLPSPLKHEWVVSHIRKNGGQDRLTLQFRWTCTREGRQYNDAQILSSSIEVHDITLKMPLTAVDNVKSGTSKIIATFKYPILDIYLLQKMELLAFRNKDSKVEFRLKAQSSGYKVLVFTHMSLLSTKNVEIGTSKKEHVFSNCTEWTFNSLSFKKSKNREFALVLRIKVVPGKEHIYGNNNILDNIGVEFVLKEIEITHMNIPFFPRVTKENPSKTIEVAEENPSQTIKVDEENPSKTIEVAEKDPSKTIKVSEQRGNAVACLLEDFKSLYQDPNFSDILLVCGEDSFQVHKNILSARSPVFKGMMSGDMTASGSVDIDDLNAPTLASFLAFMYTGTVEDLDIQTALHLCYAADKYQVPSLKKECTNFLCSGISTANVCDILSVADKRQDGDLASVAHDFILNNYSDVLGSKEWENLLNSEPMLVAKTVTHFAVKKLVGKSDVS